MTMSPVSPAFVHLRSHSEFSVVDGIARIPDLVNRFGWIKFYKAARKAGIKPIAGCAAWLRNPEDADKPFRVLLLATNHPAYLDLCVLLSRAWTENSQRGRAELEREWLSGESGLIVLS